MVRISLGSSSLTVFSVSGAELPAFEATVLVNWLFGLIYILYEYLAKKVIFLWNPRGRRFYHKRPPLDFFYYLFKLKI
jgi:hypothetical protein